MSPSERSAWRPAGRRPATTGDDHTKYHQMPHFKLYRMDVLCLDRSIWFDENNTSGAEGSQTLQIECCWRFRAFRLTKIVLPAPSSQALQIQCFHRLRSISFDENCTSGAEGSQTLRIECFLRFRASRATPGFLPACLLFSLEFSGLGPPSGTIRIVSNVTC